MKKFFAIIIVLTFAALTCAQTKSLPDSTAFKQYQKDISQLKKEDDQIITNIGNAERQIQLWKDQHNFNQGQMNAILYYLKIEAAKLDSVKSNKQGEKK